MTVMNNIGEYVNSVAYCVPIFTNDIYKYVERYIPGVTKGLVNEYIIRYAKCHPEFIRYQKGIYYKTTSTPFGKAEINYTELVKRVYLFDTNEVFGYETGPSFMNKIGLTTQVPAHTYIATERARSTITLGKDRLVLLKPVVKVTKDNYHYLQFLDLLDNRMNINIEAANRLDILRNYIDTYRLDFEKLLSYAKYYKNNKMFIGIAELAQGAV